MFLAAVEKEDSLSAPHHSTRKHSFVFYYPTSLRYPLTLLCRVGLPAISTYCIRLDRLVRDVELKGEASGGEHEKENAKQLDSWSMWDAVARGDTAVQVRVWVQVPNHFPSLSLVIP